MRCRFVSFDFGKSVAQRGQFGDCSFKLRNAAGRFPRDGLAGGQCQILDLVKLPGEESIAAMAAASQGSAVKGLQCGEDPQRQPAV